MDLEEKIAEKRNSLKTDRLDMSFGELMSLYEDADLVVTPEYQRVFRWSLYQQTRFIESVLLGIPIPPIFVAEDKNGKWEVVDGLQRISTILAFFGLLISMPEKNHTTLTSGEMVKELDGINIENLSLKLKTTIKRSVCRVEIVRWDSQEDIRYELFNRLNTGSTPLSDQEIRNCIFRSYPTDLNSLLKEVVAEERFTDLIRPTKKQVEEMYLEELVLRYFAFKDLGEEVDIRTTVPQFLTEYMRDVSSGAIEFDLELEKRRFISYIEFFAQRFDHRVFRPNNILAPHIFDSLAFSLPKVFEGYEDWEGMEAAVERLLGDEEYKSIGQNRYSNSRAIGRMRRALEICRA